MESNINHNNKKGKILYKRGAYNILVAETVLGILSTILLIVGVVLLITGSTSPNYNVQEADALGALICMGLFGALALPSFILMIIATVQMCQCTRTIQKPVYSTDGSVKEFREEVSHPLLVWGILNIFLGFIISTIALFLVKKV